MEKKNTLSRVASLLELAPLGTSLSLTVELDPALEPSTVIEVRHPASAEPLNFFAPTEEGFVLLEAYLRGLSGGSEIDSPFEQYIYWLFGKEDREKLLAYGEERARLESERRHLRRRLPELEGLPKKAAQAELESIERRLEELGR